MTSTRKHIEMKLRPGPFRDLADNTEIVQTEEIKIKDDLMKLISLLRQPLILLAVISVVSFLILSQYASADEGEGWRKGTPEPERNLWVYWESGECARWARYDPEWGFHTTTEILAEIEWWRYVIGDDPPPVRYCTYE